ncbi:MAG TPA: hypothetical protein DCL29_05520 [Eubacterium sp.]|nr:hypothetical protein [Eubacterium sp.]HAV91273.1 hypothetical protein [Eubacterium sp.]
MIDSRLVLKKLNRLYDKILMLVCVLLLLVSVYCLYDMWYIFNNVTDKGLLNYKPTEDGGMPADSPITDDMVAWLTIDDTTIDYPVMQAEDNVKYLNLNPYGEYSLSGSLFLDARNNSKFMDDYSIIYGHHMEYGKMFGALDNFLDEDYLRKHKSGTLIVGRNSDKVYKLEIFAAIHVNAKVSEIFDFDDSKITADYIEKHADVYTSRQDKKMVGFATCTTVEPEERTVIFAYLDEK